MDFIDTARLAYDMVKLRDFVNTVTNFMFLWNHNIWGSHECENVEVLVQVHIAVLPGQQHQQTFSLRGNHRILEGDAHRG
jgi:hypothetical protein